MLIFYPLRRSFALQLLNEASQSGKIGGPNDRRRSGPHAKTGCPIEHPLRQFKPSTALVTLEPATKHGMLAPMDSLHHNHAPAEPGMPRIADLLDRGTMGFLLSSCTTIDGRTARWVT